jgi:prefoldin subunit 5
MENTDLIIEINNLKNIIVVLQQNIQELQTEINSVKNIALDAQDYAKNHKHKVNTNRETHMLYHT